MNICSSDGLAPNKQSSIWTTDRLVNWRIHASLDLYELTHCSLMTPYGDMDLDQHCPWWWLVAWWHQTTTWTNVDFSYSEVQWYSPGSSFTVNAHATILYNEFDSSILLKLPPPWGQWVNSLRPSDDYICVGNLTTIGSDNGLSPGLRQAITWTNVGMLLIGPLRTNFSEMLIEIDTFSLKKIHLKMSSGK